MGPQISFGLGSERQLSMLYTRKREGKCHRHETDRAMALLFFIGKCDELAKGGVFPLHIDHRKGARGRRTCLNRHGATRGDLTSAVEEYAALKRIAGKSGGKCSYLSVQIVADKFDCGLDAVLGSNAFT